jgi:hypothetical protein
MPISQSIHLLMQATMAVQSGRAAAFCGNSIWAAAASNIRYVQRYAVSKPAIALDTA